MALITILTIGPGALITTLGQAVSEGGHAFGTRVSIHHLDAIEDPLPTELLADLTQSGGLAIGSSLPPDATEAQMFALNRLAHQAFESARISFRVATTFTSLPRDDPATERAIGGMNRLLYRWGALIVSPGYADEPSVHWLDSRPGAGALDEATPDTITLLSAVRQGRRLATVASMIDGAIARLGLLET